MRLQEGTILYFHLFYFKNSGTPPKSKYFIVIKHIGDTTLLASLPSSQKHLPHHLQSKYDCLELPDSGIGCYAFQSGVLLATNNFAFPLDSYLYGQHLEEYNSMTINEIYPFEGINYDILGCLKRIFWSLLLTVLKIQLLLKGGLGGYLNNPTYFYKSLSLLVKPPLSIFNEISL